MRLALLLNFLYCKLKSLLLVLILIIHWDIPVSLWCNAVITINLKQCLSLFLGKQQLSIRLSISVSHYNIHVNADIWKLICKTIFWSTVKAPTGMWQFSTYVLICTNTQCSFQEANSVTMLLNDIYVSPVFIS